MEIKVEEVDFHVYPYTHRVEVFADALACDKVSGWMSENKIPYSRTGWGIYYMRKEHVAWLLLRWS